MNDGITRSLLTRLAKAVSGDMRHTQKLDAFARELRYPDQTAMMADLKRKEELRPQQRGHAAPEGDQEPERTPVLANVRTEDNRVDVWADISSWLEIASIAELVRLARSGYREGLQTAPIYHFLDQHGDPDVVRVADHLAALRSTPGADPIGFELTAEEDTILPWLSVHRPDAWAALVADDIRSDGLDEEDLADLIRDVRALPGNEPGPSGDPVAWLLLHGSTREEIQRAVEAGADEFRP